MIVHTTAIELSLSSLSHLIIYTQETSGPSGMAESSPVINTYSGAEFHRPVAISGPVCIDDLTMCNAEWTTPCML